MTTDTSRRRAVDRRATADCAIIIHSDCNFRDICNYVTDTCDEKVPSLSYGTI